MKKSLQILLGLLLISVLTCVAFLDVSVKVKDNLLTKTKTMFSEKNVRGVNVEMKGEGSSMSRTLVLTGTAISEVERVRIVTLTENIEGVCSIDNQIKIHPVVPKVSLVPTVTKVPLVKVSTKSVATENTPKELVSENNAQDKPVENKTSITSVSKTIIEVPAVPTVKKKNIVVPTPIKVISTPKVIEVEKIKIEGVK